MGKLGEGFSKLIVMHDSSDIQISYNYIEHYSMSFIFQRILSGSKISPSETSIKPKNYMFAFKKATITSAKQLSEIESKTIIFKTFKSFCNVLLVLITFMMTKIDNSEDQDLMLYLSSLFACSSVLFFVFQTLNQHKLQNQNAKGCRISVSIVLKYTLSSLFYLVHPNYLFVGEQVYIDNQQYDINNVLSVVTHFRIFTVVFFFIEISRFYGLRVSRVFDIYAVKDKFSRIFAIKALFRHSGLKIPVIMLVLGLIIVSFIGVNLSRIHGEQFEQDFLEEIYQTVITMTTVGYGDLIMDELYQKVQIFFVVIMGSFTSSVVTLTVLNFFKLDDKQQKSYFILKRLEIKQRITEEQKRIVSETMKYRSKDANLKDFLEEIRGEKLKQYKQELNDCQRNESLTQFFSKNYQQLISSIKKIGERQLIVKNMMNFYIERRVKVETEMEQNKIAHQSVHPKSQKSCRPRKRVDDGKAIMKCFKMILSQR